MPRLAETLVELGDPLAQAQGVELLAVEVGKERGERFVQVILDKEGGLNLEDCERFHAAFGVLLDELDPIPGRYRLEVASPGEKRPLRGEADFRRFIGQEVRLNVAGSPGRPLVGVLGPVEQGLVIVRKANGDTVSVPLEGIERARLTGR